MIRVENKKYLPFAAGYSGKALAQKLGLKDDMKMTVIDPPKHYWELVGELPNEVSVCESMEKALDLIHAFVMEKSGLSGRLQGWKKQITPNGMIWILWPKKIVTSSNNVNENVIRKLAIKTGLVDTKVCAIDEIWSGLKLVIRLNNRD